MLMYFSSIANAMYSFFSGNADEGVSGNVFFENDVIYSFGRHFPLAVRLKSGRYLVNGDRYSKTTSKHQSWVFGEVHESNRVEIPFSALRNVGISDHRNIEIVNRTGDRWIPTNRLTKDGEPIEVHLLGAAVIKYEDRYFLSHIDSTASAKLGYNLTELVQPVDTVDEAFQSLKPPTVIEAEEKGLTVDRQGEWFFIPTGLHDKDFSNEIIEEGSLIHRADKLPMHCAQYQTTSSGRQYAKGWVKHREKEHKVLRLYPPKAKPIDRQWYEVHENIQVESWKSDGNVD